MSKTIFEPLFCLFVGVGAIGLMCYIITPFVGALLFVSFGVEGDYFVTVIEGFGATYNFFVFSLALFMLGGPLMSKDGVEESLLYTKGRYGIFGYTLLGFVLLFMVWLFVINLLIGVL